MHPRWRIHNARIIDPATGRDATGDLLVDGDRIVDSLPDGAGAETVEADGLVAVPGLIDLHVHLREPGREAAETIASGCEAAARGGFTTILAMPNTTPPIDLPARVRRVLEQDAATRRARVLTSACLTRDRAGRYESDLPALADAGAAAFTDDGSTVPDEHVLRRAMQSAAALARPVLDHALDPQEAGNGVMHDGPLARRMGLPGIPSHAESAMVNRDIRLACETNCHMHIQHISARESVDLLREARRQGAPVSGEATPHHLALTDHDIWRLDPDFKMNPPLRSAQDRDALQEAVIDGTIEAFATDHAPHLQSEKALGFVRAPFGIVGLETAVGITYTLLVKNGRLTLLDWVRRWTTGPARILNLPPPTLAPGAAADFTLLDLAAEWTVDPARFASKSRNTPFKGHTLTGRPVLTVCGGRLTWDARS